MKFRGDFMGAPSGSVGGLTFSHNRGGYYVRKRIVPTNPNSVRQQAVRSALSSLAPMWGTLTQEQRDAWNQYAAGTPVTDKLGDAMHLTGQQMFIRNNTPRLQAGLAVVENGPSIFNHGDIGTIELQGVNYDDIQAEWTFAGGDPWTTVAGSAILVYAGKPIGPGRGFYKGPFRYVGAVLGAVVPPTSPQTTPVGSSGFTYSVNQVAAMRFVLTQADGRLTAGTIVGPVPTIETP